MSDLDLSQEIKQIRGTFATIAEVTDVPKLDKEIEQLEIDVQAPNLWDNAAEAQKLTSALSRKQAQRTRIQDIANRLDDLEVLIELATSESDKSAATAQELEVMMPLTLLKC